MGLDIEKVDVQKLVQNKELMEETIKGILDDPKAMDDLAEEVANKLAGILEDDQNFKEKAIYAALARPDFARRIANKLRE